jgi:hypothetical protein
MAATADRPDQWERDYAAALASTLDGWCAKGSHYYVRCGDAWSCRHCGDPAPQQPGVREAS